MSQSQQMNQDDSNSENSSPDINVSVTFRHTEPTEALKAYATEKFVNCLEKFVVSDSDVHVILSVEKRDHVAEARVSSKRFDLSGKGTTEDLYSAIDKAVDIVSTQVRKQKEIRIERKHSQS